MARPQKLSSAEVRAALRSLDGWRLRAGKLAREYKFKDFAGAFRWMTAIANEAERLNHHPDWKNVYNRVAVELQTHDAGGITELDIKLAERMELLFASETSAKKVKAKKR